MNSIFLPTYNAQKFVAPLFGVLSQLHGDDYRVCVVDSSSSDLTVSKIEDFGVASVHVIPGQQFDHGGTRSMAGEMCRGDIVVFLTQDALPLSVDDIKRLVAVFADSKIGAAYGRQIPYADTNMFGKHLREFNYADHSHVRSFSDKARYGFKTAFLSNSFAAYRCSAMDEIGWFKDGLIMGEDTYAGAKLLQAGYELAYVAEARVYHSHSYTVMEEFKRYFDIGVFHKMEGWILALYGKPEGDGVRYVKSEFNYLLAHKSFHLIPVFIIRNAMKLLGYKLGKNYSHLPRVLIKRLSMHHRWWNSAWARQAIR